MYETWYSQNLFFSASTPPAKSVVAVRTTATSAVSALGGPGGRMGRLLSPVLRDSRVACGCRGHLPSDSG